MTAQWKANVPSIPAGACTGTYGSQVNVNLAVNGVQNFDYNTNKSPYCAYLQKEGYYKLEVWGAAGGSYINGIGGYGGYSFGEIHLDSSSSIYLAIGQKGYDYNSGVGSAYNGGGSQQNDGYNLSGGGGTTHISTYNCGELKNCSSHKSDILIVAGGGGGGGLWSNYGYANGGNGGGITGGEGYWASALSSSYGGYGGDQTSGGEPCKKHAESYFCAYTSGYGQGGYSGSYTAGGGGGYYGGGQGAHGGGGGGSGYIGNSLLLPDKGMYQYSGGAGNCTPSSDVSTKTTCTSSTGHASANAANTGNGYARITYLGT